MAKIQLDALELKNQSIEMMALGAEYEGLFTGVNSILSNVNDNWSPNLANNFSGKISNAQKSFSAVTEMLKFGADAARNSAETFESIDTQISKGLKNLKSTLKANGTIAEVVTSMPGFKNYKDCDVHLNNQPKLKATVKIKDDYDKLPEWAKELLDEYYKTNDMDTGIDVINLIIDIFAEDPENWKTLDVNPDIIGGIAGLFIDSSIHVKAVKETFDAVINPSDKFGEYITMMHQLESISLQKLWAGDILGGLEALGIYMGVGMGTICYGTVEVVSELANSYLEKFWKLNNSMLDTTAKIIPGRLGDTYQIIADNSKQLQKSVCNFISDLF